MGTYIPQEHLGIQAVQYDGTNLDDVLEIIPQDAASFKELYRSLDILVTYTADPYYPRLMHVGDWASWDGKTMTLHSNASFKSFWREVK